MDKKVKVNQIVEIIITDIANNGDGIGKYEGYTLFVSNTIIGDEILVKISKANKNYGFAKVEKVIKSSPYRVKARCQLAGKCGGCQIQELDYNKQLEFKENKIINSLTRIGGFDNINMEPICGMDNPYYYRNKSQTPVGLSKDNKAEIGFYEKGTHTIIDTNHCYIGSEVNNEIIKLIRVFIDEFKIRPYDEVNHKGLFRHILTRVSNDSKEVMVCLILNADKVPHEDILIERLIDKFPSISSICLNVNKGRSNVILGKEIKIIWGRPYILDTIGQIKYRISPLSFYQVNPMQTKRLYDTAMEYAGLTGEEIVFDLYCGIGTIGLYLARNAKKVYGVEIVEEAIEDAKANAKMNNIDNVEFYAGPAEEIVENLYREKKVRADLVIVDPPRKGCDLALLDTIIKMKVEKLVYISCDLATLARDLKYLGENGFRLERVRGVDMFPHTVHVETVVSLSHKNADSFISIKMDYADDRQGIPDKVTYKLIQEYIENKYDFKVHTAYIAEVKRSLGLPMYDAPNAVEELKHPYKPAPEFKVEAIKDALKHFKVI